MSRFNRLEVELADQVLAVRFVDEQLFEHMVLSEVQDELLGLLEDGDAVRMLIDFSRVEFCSTSLINCLLRLQRELTAQGGGLALCNMRGNVREAFQMLNLEGTVFAIFDTFAEASSQLRPEATDPPGAVS